MAQRIETNVESIAAATYPRSLWRHSICLLSRHDVNGCFVVDNTLREMKATLFES
jgi:hypothetical protein